MSKRTFYAFLAIILAGIIAFIGCFFGIPEFNAMVKNAFTSGGVAENPDKTDEPDGSNLVMALSDNFAEMSLTTFSNTASKNSVTITATVEPETAVNKDVNFTLTTEDGGWADEYVSMSVNGNTATVTCLRAFPMPIILTATAVGNPKLVETCTFDYLAGVDFRFNYPLTDFADYIYSNGDYGLSFAADIGIGSIQPEDFKISALYFELSSDFTNKIQTNDFYCDLMDIAPNNSIYLNNLVYLDKWYPIGENITYSGPLDFRIRTMCCPDSFFYIDEESPNLTGNALEYAYASFKQTAQETSNNLRLVISWTAKYQGELKGGHYYSDYMTMNAEDIESIFLDGSNIKLNHSNIIFGDI